MKIEIKEKIDIKNLGVRITKLRKGNKGTIILGCEKERELEKLKTTVQNKLGEDYKVMEPKKIEPKIKIINVGEKEIKLEEDDLIDTILKQNRMDRKREGFYIKLVKIINKDGKNDNMRFNDRKNESFLIFEVDEVIHELMLKREKINMGWRKCFVFDYFSVKRF